ncbi:DUF645 family protein [Vibrio cholerae]|nr:DUF645 family protein [Vibrio cholerae]
MFHKGGIIAVIWLSL